MVITEYLGYINRNELSLSSASAIKYSLLPGLALDFISGNIPPTTIVGSFDNITAESIDDVVVFPCVPATAIPVSLFKSLASNSPLFNRVIPLFFA